MANRHDGLLLQIGTHAVNVIGKMGQGNPILLVVHSNFVRRCVVSKSCEGRIIVKTVVGGIAGGQVIGRMVGSSHPYKEEIMKIVLYACPVGAWIDPRYAGFIYLKDL